MGSILYLEQIALAFMAVLALCVIYLLVKNIKLYCQNIVSLTSALNEFVYVIMWFASIVCSLYFLPQFGMWPGKLETVIVGTLFAPLIINIVLWCLVNGMLRCLEGLGIAVKHQELLSLKEEAAN